MTPPPAPARWRKARRAAWAGALAVWGAVVGPGALRVGAEGDHEVLEPRPPWIFFPEPDPKTAAEIEDLVTNSFADQNKVVPARTLLVRRYGVLSVPRLTEEMLRDNNQPAAWNALLTVSALRDRVGPARELWPLLDPMLRFLRDHVEPYHRAFAALALGSFHGPDTVLIPRGTENPLQGRDRPRLARQALREAGRLLAYVLTEDSKHPHVRVACALALAKRGGDDSGEARTALLRDVLWQDALGVAPRQAVILALGFLPGAGDEARLQAALRHEEARVRRAAALAISLQALSDRPPPWMPAAAPGMLRALTSDPVRPALEDGAEAVFTRGVLALRAGVSSQWPLLFSVAVDPASGDEAATAAAQILLFCPEPWLAPRAIEYLRIGVGLPEPVVAAFLRIAGRSGLAEGIAVCRDYLGNKARRPAGREEWDVRYHAASGILEALAAGALKDAQVRRDAVAALEAGVRRGMPEGAVKTRLDRLLEQRRAVLADPKTPLPEGDARALAAAFSCPYGVLASEVEAAAIHRTNVLVPLLFNVHGRRGGTPGEPDRTDQPQRFLQSSLERHPYFRRIELKAGRGLRAPEAFQGAEDAAREVRNPP